VEKAEMTKPTVRVKAGSAVHGVQPVRPQAGYLRDTQSAVIRSRPATLTEHRDDVRRVWQRAAGLAMDMIQNSGQLRGVADQMIADSCGVELLVNYQPNLAPFGYEPEEAKVFKKLVRERFRVWCWDKRECHGKGDWTIPQQADLSIRNWLAFGESAGIVEFMRGSMRNRYGLTTGTKYSVFSPARIVQDTSEMERMFQGVLRDENGRVSGYRCTLRERGVTRKIDLPARDRAGRQLFVHVFDPVSAEDERGISPLAATFRSYLMGENVDDAVAQTMFLQTMYAIVMTSERPSVDAFEGLEALKEAGAVGTDAIATDFLNYFKAQLDKAAEGEIKVGDRPGISNMAPGESLDFKNLTVPGPDYAPFRKSINRNTARALGVSYGGYTLDFESASYASTNMENASVYPMAVRRTDRIVAPNYLVPFASWLDEEIGEGRIGFKGGHEVFAANREALTWAELIPPPKPSADDEKRDRAVTERILNGTSTMEVECAARGLDPEEVFESRVNWHKKYVAAGVPSPFDRKAGSMPSQEGKDNKEKAA
jgi:capsid protein